MGQLSLPKSPFSQRVWIALEAKGISYQYCETDAYKTPVPANLLEANPKGLVPVIRQDDWALADSAVILEYVCFSVPFPGGISGLRTNHPLMILQHSA